MNAAFGEALADALADLRVTTTEAGRLAGVSPSRISQWTHGDPISPEQVFAIERGLGCPPGQLSHYLGYLPIEAITWPESSLSQAIRADPDLGRNKILQDFVVERCRDFIALAQQLDGD